MRTYRRGWSLLGRDKGCSCSEISKEGTIKEILDDNSVWFVENRLEGCKHVRSFYNKIIQQKKKHRPEWRGVDGCKTPCRHRANRTG